MRLTSKDTKDHNGMKKNQVPILVAKLCLGTQLFSKLCFAARATELPGHWHSQTEFGNEAI
jgi:hypothetical protein